MLDLFAGTGALGLEALSRGARHVTFVDRTTTTLRALRATLGELGVDERSQVENGDAVAVLGRLQRSGPRFDVVLLDPPYDSDLLARVLPLLAAGQVLAAEGVIVVEHRRQQPLPECEGLRTIESRRYGDTLIDVLGHGPLECAVSR